MKGVVGGRGEVAGKLKSFVKSSGSDREISCRAPRKKEKRRVAAGWARVGEGGLRGRGPLGNPQGKGEDRAGRKEKGPGR